MYVNEKTEGRKQNPLSRAIKMEIVFFGVIGVPGVPGALWGFFPGALY